MEAQTAESSACCFCQLPVNLTYEKGVSWVGPVDMVLPSTDSRPSLPSPLYAHASCTKWHDQILLDEDGYVDDFNELKRIITRSQRELCDHCSESGSTLRCSVPHCSWRSHYPCAKIQQATFVGSFQKIFCKKHKHLAAEVEISEQSYFLVERILSHRDVPTGVEGKLLREYLVKWQGYDALEDATWEPATSFAHPYVLKEYQNRLKAEKQKLKELKSSSSSASSVPSSGMRRSLRSQPRMDVKQEKQEEEQRETESKSSSSAPRNHSRPRRSAASDPPSSSSSSHTASLPPLQMERQAKEQRQARAVRRANHEEAHILPSNISAHIASFSPRNSSHSRPSTRLPHAAEPAQHTERTEEEEKNKEEEAVENNTSSPMIKCTPPPPPLGVSPFISSSSSDLWHLNRPQKVQQQNQQENIDNNINNDPLADSLGFCAAHPLSPPLSSSSPMHVDAPDPDKPTSLKPEAAEQTDMTTPEAADEHAKSGLSVDPPVSSSSAPAPSPFSTDSPSAPSSKKLMLRHVLSAKNPYIVLKKTGENKYDINCILDRSKSLSFTNRLHLSDSSESEAPTKPRKPRSAPRWNAAVARASKRKRTPSPHAYQAAYPAPPSSRAPYDYHAGRHIRHHRRRSTSGSRSSSASPSRSRSHSRSTSASSRSYSRSSSSTSSHAHESDRKQTEHAVANALLGINADLQEKIERKAEKKRRKEERRRRRRQERRLQRDRQRIEMMQYNIDVPSKTSLMSSYAVPAITLATVAQSAAGHEEAADNSNKPRTNQEPTESSGAAGNADVNHEHGTRANKKAKRTGAPAVQAAVSASAYTLPASSMITPTVAGTTDYYSSYLASSTSAYPYSSSTAPAYANGYNTMSSYSYPQPYASYTQPMPTATLPHATSAAPLTLTDISSHPQAYAMYQSSMNQLDAWYTKELSQNPNAEAKLTQQYYSYQVLYLSMFDFHRGSSAAARAPTASVNASIVAPPLPITYPSLPTFAPYPAPYGNSTMSTYFDSTGKK